MNTSGGAIVLISDYQGMTEKLTDRGQGLYEPSATGIKGIIGRKYHITIKTPDGKTYVSNPELLKPVAEFGKFYTEYQETNSAKLRGQFAMYVDCLLYTSRCV